MALWSLLRHRLQAAVRAPFVGRQALSLILGGFLALYLGGGLVLVGLVFDDLVREVAPGADPLLVAAKGLLPFGLGYAALRVVMESGLGVDPRPYQALPVRRSALVGVLAVFAPLSLWNAVPLAFIVAVGVEGALNGTGGAALRFGLAGLGVLAAVTYAAPMLRRAASDRPFRAAGAVGLLVAAAAIEAVDLGVGLVSLVDVSAWLFGGVVRGDVLPTSVAALGLVGLVGGMCGGCGGPWSWTTLRLGPPRTDRASGSTGWRGVGPSGGKPSWRRGSCFAMPKPAGRSSLRSSSFWSFLDFPSPRSR
ncbi:hypothetical protein GGP96_001453 [Salinibacter ruber]|nr:hypothetical protein [Salinibacter ruber]